MISLVKDLLFIVEECSFGRDIFSCANSVAENLFVDIKVGFFENILYLMKLVQFAGIFSEYKLGESPEIGHFALRRFFGLLNILLFLDFLLTIIVRFVVKFFKHIDLY